MTIVQELMLLSGGSLEASTVKTIARPDRDDEVDPASGGWTIEGSAPAVSFFGSVNEEVIDDDVTYIKMTNILSGTRENLSLGFDEVADPLNDEGVFLQILGKIMDTASGTMNIDVNFVDPVTFDRTFIRKLLVSDFPKGTGDESLTPYGLVDVSIPLGTITDFQDIIFELSGFQQGMLHPDGGGMRVTQMFLCIPNGFGGTTSGPPPVQTIAEDTFTSTLTPEADLDFATSGYVSDLGFGGWVAAGNWKLRPAGSTDRAEAQGSGTSIFPVHSVNDVANDNFECFLDIDQFNGSGVDMEYRHNGNDECFIVGVSDAAGQLVVSLSRVIAGTPTQVENLSVGVAWPNVDINGGYRMGAEVVGNQVEIYVEDFGGGNRVNLIQQTTSATFWDMSNGGSDLNDASHRKFGWAQGSNGASFNSFVDNFNVIA